MEVFAARIGLTARGIVYILMGALAYLIAGGARAYADQKSALQVVLLRPGGQLLVGLMAIGFVCYALWRFFEAAFGVTAEKNGIGYRLISFTRGLIYTSLAITAISVVKGSNQSQGSQQRNYTVDVMSRPGGRLAIGLVGLVIVAVGIFSLNEGMNSKFMRYFQGQNLSPVEKKWIRLFGRFGFISRGFVFTIMGVLFAFAAWSRNTSKATGLDGALKTLRDQPLGGLLLRIVATGLVIFGIYGLAEARYRKI